MTKLAATLLFSLLLLMSGCSFDATPSSEGSDSADTARTSALETGKTYYVATNGKDTAAGTAAAPWKTITHAVAQMQAGDTTYVRGGTYSEKLIRFERSGTATAPITLSNAPGESPIIDFGQDPSVDNFTDIRRITISSAAGSATPIGWITIEGFEIRNGYEGIKFYSLRDATIRRNWIHHNRNQGILGDGDRVVMDQNRINHNGPIVQCVGKCNLQHGIYVGGHSNVVTNNLIYDNLAFGIQLNGSSKESADWLIANNTIALNRNRSGIVLWGSPKDIRVENNVFYDNCNGYQCLSTSGQGLSISSGVRGAKIRNNLFHATGSGATLPWASSSTLTEGLHYTASGNIINTLDPKFQGASAGDFLLQPGSPAIDQGLTLSEVTWDHAGGPRPWPVGGKQDIGAYEYGAPEGGGSGGTSGGPGSGGADAAAGSAGVGVAGSSGASGGGSGGGAPFATGGTTASGGSAPRGEATDVGEDSSCAFRATGGSKSASLLLILGALAVGAWRRRRARLSMSSKP
ncbi:MAG: right-handed parallel beta-helix repeat-containing protein [Polyangiaceae bacterium]